MQKKIIALAIAGLASTAAFAQTNVTIYGSVDAGYSYRFDPETKAARNSGNSNSRSSIDTGNHGGNRLGFKGTEDLGNGLKAVFLLEQGFTFDGSSATNSQGGRTFGRQAYVGLTGGFGTAIAGRLYTPFFSLWSSVDPFGAGTVGEARNVWSSGGGVDGLLDPVRVDNAVAYVSPNFGGFDVTLAYSNGTGIGDAATAENANNNARNNTVYAVLAKYAAGPVNVGLNVHRIAAGSGIANSTAKSVDNYTLAGTFDAKVVKVHALATYNVVDSSASRADFTGSNYMLGLSVPVGKATIKTSVNYSDYNGEANSGLKGVAVQYALGADYALSKRTNVYTAYALQDSQSARAATSMGTADVSNNGMAGTANPFQQGFQVGVRHQF